MRHRLIPSVLVLLSLGLVAVGCGSKDPETPTACRDGAVAFTAALASAPGTVALDDGSPISGCLVPNQSGAILSRVGLGMTRAASRLSAEARSDPGGQSNVELGYLVGAAGKGAEITAGIHTELIRRIEASAGYSPGGAPLPPAFKKAYREGLSAGRDSG